LDFGFMDFQIKKYSTTSCGVGVSPAHNHAPEIFLKPEVFIHNLSEHLT
jgi:hypothetical protein